MFYKENLRSVTTDGVDFGMNLFFSCLNDKTFVKKNIAQQDVIPACTTTVAGEDDVVCEEELLAAFGPKEVGL